MFEFEFDKNKPDCFSKILDSGECEKTMSKDGKDGKDDTSSMGFGCIGDEIVIDKSFQ